jgi:DNA-binding MarR family transcriptional regulator
MDTAEAYRLLIADVYELAGASRRTSEGLARAAGQTVARWHALSVFSVSPLTVASAARRLGLARQSVQRVVDGLVTDGLLSSAPNPDHKTAPLVAITPQGADVLARLVALADADRGARLSGLAVTVEDLSAARATVAKVLTALTSPTEPN